MQLLETVSKYTWRWRICTSRWMIMKRLHTFTNAALILQSSLSILREKLRLIVALVSAKRRSSTSSQLCLILRQLSKRRTVVIWLTPRAQSQKTWYVFINWLRMNTLSRISLICHSNSLRSAWLLLRVLRTRTLRQSVISRLEWFMRRKVNWTELWSIDNSSWNFARRLAIVKNKLKRTSS